MCCNMEKFYDLNRVFLCQFVVSDFSDDYAESKGKEEYWQLFYMENDGVFRDLFFDRYIPSISSGYHKLSMCLLSLSSSKLRRGPGESVLRKQEENRNDH